MRWLFLLLPELLLLTDCRRRAKEETRTRYQRKEPAVSIFSLHSLLDGGRGVPHGLHSLAPPFPDALTKGLRILQPTPARGFDRLGSEFGQPHFHNFLLGHPPVAFRLTWEQQNGPYALDPNCNSSELREIIVQGISDSPSDSKHRINAAIARNLDGSFGIVCAECAFSYLAHTIQDHYAIVINRSVAISDSGLRARRTIESYVQRAVQIRGTFARDCQYSLTQEVRTETYNRYLASVQPTTLHKYIHHNRQTVYDYGHFGNAYYPNYTPWHEISGAYTVSGLYGTPRAQAAQLENEWQWTRGGNYPYMRADNIVNQALQQTMLPTCLHDVIYCAKLSIAQQQAARAANAAASDPSILQ
ncbi:hypothetical protein PRIPAC_92200 [Pristionchus pacificus]|uniref:Ground-like domain-containing protein n=1 Tax=Pristionchus pacificus TaxID=54126 RepID=A0A2A6CDG4_PRIPA|nr:hypothetical protein PRIPAC_92200 [Pristionchus pacificus]|eukprot:PDM76252.1 hypothetical protein PRIPAC_39856 [Pristionchus pacificus]